MGQLDAVWRHSRLSLSTKLRLYTSLVQSVYTGRIPKHGHWSKMTRNV